MKVKIRVEYKQGEDKGNDGQGHTKLCNNIQIENVDSYIYLGQRYSNRDKNQDKEIPRRITGGWTTFARHRDIFNSDIGTCLKSQHLQLMRTSSNDIRRGNMGTHHPCKKQASSRTKMERSMLNITYRERKTNIWVREMTKGHRRDWTSQKTDVDLGRAGQQDTR